MWSCRIRGGYICSAPCISVLSSSLIVFILFMNFVIFFLLDMCVRLFVLRLFFFLMYIAFCCSLRDLLAVFLFPVSSLSSSYSTCSCCVLLGLSLSTIFSIKFPLISLLYCDSLIRILYSSRTGHKQVSSVQLVTTVFYGKMLHVCLGSCKLE